MDGITREQLEACARIPIAFTVASRLRVETLRCGLAGMTLVEEPVAPPYVKDYDAQPDGGPACWAGRFDVSAWRMIMIHNDNGAPAAAATVAFRTPGVLMLEDDPNLAVLWDLRVRPELRGRGFGRRAFAQAAGWARERGCHTLKIETQNMNVAACRFYAAMGAELARIDRRAYPDFPDEVQLLWRYALRAADDVAAMDRSRGSASPLPGESAWRVRAGVAADAAAVFACDPLATTDATRCKAIREGLAKGRVWVATRGTDDTVAGYMILSPSFFGRLFVELLGVAPSCRRRGAGAALLGHARALSAGRDVFTSTNLSNLPMRRLLARCGWMEAGWVDGLDPDDPEVFFKAGGRL